MHIILIYGYLGVIFCLTVTLYSEEDANPEPVGGFNAVPFSYGNYEDSSEQKIAETESEIPQFHPPFPVPDSLVQNLVSSNTSALNEIYGLDVFAYF